MPLLQTKADASAWGYGFLGATASTGNFFLISKQVLGSTSATVTFSSIPNTYKSLQIRSIARDSGSNSQDIGFAFNFNSDTGNNYTYHRLYTSEGGTIVANAGSSEPANYMWGCAGGGFASNIFSASTYDIIDYASTSKNKTLRGIGGTNNNTSSANPFFGISSGLWMSTSAINSITITDFTNNFVAGSTFALYGVS